jgi:hypothetical protein
MLKVNRNKKFDGYCAAKIFYEDDLAPGPVLQQPSDDRAAHRRQAIVGSTIALAAFFMRESEPGQGKAVMDVFPGA